MRAGNWLGKETNARARTAQRLLRILLARSSGAPLSALSCGRDCTLVAKLGWRIKRHPDTRARATQKKRSQWRGMHARRQPNKQFRPVHAGRAPLVAGLLLRRRTCSATAVLFPLAIEPYAARESPLFLCSGAVTSLARLARCSWPAASWTADPATDVRSARRRLFGAGDDVQMNG